MIVYRTRTDLAAHLDDLRRQGKTTGLVPTMGALHEGHLSLLQRSASENDATVVSVFVNPTQFNDPDDLEKYPRTPDHDLMLLRENQVDVVFFPSVEEMYPGEDRRIFDLAGLDQGMEGARRGGHFNGVAQIVTKLFDLVGPHRAYFGQKDFQQLVIVKHLTRSLGLKTEIVPCPIIREKDGLALSSRNVRLSKQERKAAPFVYQSLVEANKMVPSSPPEEIRGWIKERFASHPLFHLDYFEIVEDKHLKPIESWDDKVNKVACIAVLLGEVRLIDNLIFD